jgi:hypothetical protein
MCLRRSPRQLQLVAAHMVQMMVLTWTQQRLGSVLS